MVSPPTSPAATNVSFRPMSMLAKPRERSGSRMSMGSRHGTGSRASDEDTRTAVRVGASNTAVLWPPSFVILMHECREDERQETNIIIYLLYHSRPCSTSSQTYRSELRISSTTISAKDSQCHNTYITRCRVTTREESLSFRSCFSRRNRPERNMGICLRQCQFFHSGV